MLIVQYIDCPPTPEEYVSKAVNFCNTELFGTLSATIVVKDDLLTNEHVKQGISDLKYGSIAINVWSAAMYSKPNLTWGAFPGETLDNVESGIGIVKNYMM